MQTRHRPTSPWTSSRLHHEQTSSVCLRAERYVSRYPDMSAFHHGETPRCASDMPQNCFNGGQAQRRQRGCALAAAGPWLGVAGQSVSYPPPICGTVHIQYTESRQKATEHAPFLVSFRRVLASPPFVSFLGFAAGGHRARRISPSFYEVHLWMPGTTSTSFIVLC